MNLDFAAAIATLNEQSDINDAAFQLANQARPPSVYLWQTLLPEINMPTYTVSSSNMTVRPTMAGLVGMDSPYPPGGVVELSTFLENTAKIAIHNELNEQMLRQLQQMVMQLMVNGLPTNEAAAQEALNFLQLMIIQPLMDTSEWLRSRVFQTGQIDWNFNKKSLVVDYGVPAENILPTRTVAAGTYYGGATSSFWADIRLLRSAVGRLRVIVAHPDTVEMARYNTANQMIAVSGSESDGTITFRRWARNSAGEDLPGQFSQDTGETVTIVLYDREAEILDLANPGGTLVIPFISPGKLVAVGDVTNEGYRPGMGAQEANVDPRRLGYTHVAPTVEGGGRMGRWSRLYVPQTAPWSLAGEGAQNLLPVVEKPEAIAIATTEMD